MRATLRWLWQHCRLLQIAAFIQENCLKSTVFYAQRGESTASSTATSSSKQRRRRLLTGATRNSIKRIESKI
jgi:hypothetical protein